MPYLGISRLEFETNIAKFEINTLELVKLQNFMKKTKMPKFWDQKCVIWLFLG